MRARTPLIVAPALLLLVLALCLPSGCSRHGTVDEKSAGAPPDSGEASAVVAPAPPPAESAAPAVPGYVTVDSADGVTSGAMVSPWELGLGRVSEAAVAASQSPSNITLDGADGVTASDMVAISQEVAGSGSASSLSTLVQDGSGSIGANLASEAPPALFTAGVALMISVEHAAGVLGRAMVRQSDLESRQGHADGA